VRNRTTAAAPRSPSARRSERGWHAWQLPRRCGILAHGFLRLGCDTCHQELLLPFSCKRRGFCPSCASRRMAQTAAHLVERVIPWVPTRQWVVSVPIPLRYWLASSQDLTAKVHTILRTTIAQYYVNQAVTGGVPRDKVQPGSMTFLQRFGSALNVKVFDVDCAYLSAPLSFLLARLRHGVGSRVLIPWG
jgi:Transposase zinc-binding domain